MSYRVLDLFCGGGGCSVGYHRAGLQPYGVDVFAQPHYPFLSVEQADAFDVLRDVEFCRGFDLIHASPPCKDWTALSSLTGGNGTGWMLTECQRLLPEIGVPWVIENVEGAPMPGAITLCGSMFGLGFQGAVLKRHRLFQTSMPLTPPAQHKCKIKGQPVVGVYGVGGAWTRTAPGGGGVKVSGTDAATALGVDWTANQRVLSQMVPPAYTEFIGAQLLTHLAVSAA